MLGKATGCRWLTSAGDQMLRGVSRPSDLSDFKTAALVLNDRMSTVEKNYAHLRSSEGANRMTELLGATLRRM